MIRIKFVQNYRQYKKGDIESLSPNEAFGLIDSGKAIISKDMTETDQHIASIPSVFTKPNRLNIKEK